MGFGKSTEVERHSKWNLPQPFGIDKSYLSGCFTRPNMRYFYVIIVGWALTVGCRALERVIMTVGARRSILEKGETNQVSEVTPD